jgi:hypothetical protein
MPKPVRLDGTAVNPTSVKIVAAAAPGATLGGGQNMTEIGGCACEIDIGPIFQGPTFEGAAACARPSIRQRHFPS